MILKYNLRKILFCLVLLFANPLFGSTSDAVNVSIPDMSGTPGTIVEVPIQVDDVTSKGIYSAGIKLNFSSTVLEAKSVNISGTLLQDWGEPTVNILTGDMYIAAAGSAPLAGSGTLLKINFEVKGTAGSSTTISFTEMTFNEGTPATNTTNGLFTVSESGGAALIVDPSTLNFSATFGAGDPADLSLNITNGGSGTLTWSATNSKTWLSITPAAGTAPSSITVSVNTSGLAAGTYSDTITVTAPGASGSPKYVPVSLQITSEGGLVVSIPDSSAASGANIAIPIRVTDVTGQGIFAFGCTLTFDADVLEATGATSTGSLSQTWGAPTTNTSSGEIKIGAAGSSALAGSGDLLWINFQVKGVDGDSTSIHFDEFKFNEGSPATTTVDGLFSVTQGGGEDITVNVPDSSAASGADIAIPIRITDVTGQGIFAFGCTLTFDSNVLEATGATSTGSLSQTWGAPTVNTASGEIQIGAAGSAALAGSGDFLWINFHVKGGDGTSTTIHFDEFIFNEGSPAATTVDGLFSVTQGGGEDITVNVPDSSAASGANIAIPIRVTDVTGQGIFAFGCKLTFDSNVLEATGATSTGSLSQTWGAPTVNTASGEIQIGAAGSAALAGSGDLLWINFHVKGGDGTSTTIHFDEFIFNEGSPAATTVDGLLTVTTGSAVSKTNETPNEFSLSQNYPNPFNPTTKIKYSITQNSLVNITVYDISGKLVKTIVNHFQTQGAYQISWQGTDNYDRKVPSGVYLYRIEAGQFKEIKKMTLLK